MLEGTKTQDRAVRNSINNETANSNKSLTEIGDITGTLTRQTSYADDLCNEIKTKLDSLYNVGNKDIDMADDTTNPNPNVTCAMDEIRYQLHLQSKTNRKLGEILVRLTKII